MKLLIEQIDDFKVLTESTENGPKKYFMEGIFMQSERVNRNKRLYPKNIMENEVNRYINEYVNTNQKNSFADDQREIGKYIKFIREIFDEYGQLDIYFNLARKYFKDSVIWKQNKDEINFSHITSLY